MWSAYFFSDYYLSSTKHPNQKNDQKTIHELVLPKLPALRKSNLVFNYICGVTSAQGASDSAVLFYCPFRVSISVLTLFFSLYQFQKQCSLNILQKGPSFGTGYSSVNTAPFEYYNLGMHTFMLVLKKIHKCFINLPKMACN